MLTYLNKICLFLAMDSKNDIIIRCLLQAAIFIEYRCTILPLSVQNRQTKTYADFAY